LYDGPQQEVFLRVGEVDGVIYLDRADDRGRVVEITADGWRDIANSQARFLRPAGMLPLPEPERGGDVKKLRKFINTASDDDWRLVLGWLLAVVRPRGPYPHLALHGPQGFGEIDDGTKC